jgi:UDP-N-acetylglucosamine acyltransferase
MTNIHPTAKVSQNSVIGENVTIGANVIVHPFVNITGVTEIGEGTEIFPFASIGTAPQDLKYAGEPTKLIIGKNNKIREHVTMNTGTVQDASQTIVGDNCLFMTGAHVAHDCVVGNNVILANNATIAGHVVVGDHAIIGGLSAVHQFVRIGKHAMIGGMTGVDADVIPYGNVFGERGSLQGLNLVGLKRRGFEKSQIVSMRSAFETIFEGDGNFAERVAAAKLEFAANPAVMDIIDFLSADTSRAICRPK